MYLDEPFAAGGWSGPLCQSCKQPIASKQQSLRVIFNHDPDGARGYTGEYHLECSKPFAALARVMNMTVGR